MAKEKKGHKGTKTQRFTKKNTNTKKLEEFQEDIQLYKNKFLPLSIEEERIGRAIVNAAFEVHKQLGPGLLERVYEVCFCHVLSKQGYFVKRQLEVPIVFDGIKFDEGLRLDVMVNELVVCDLKALDNVNPVWEAQLLSHLKLSEKRLGYLINFNVPLIKDGIKRMVL